LSCGQDKVAIGQSAFVPVGKLLCSLLGWCRQREKIDWQEPRKLIVGWCGRFLFFVLPRQFSQDIGEWPENQILIPDWTCFHCPGRHPNGGQQQQHKF